MTSSPPSGSETHRSPTPEEASGSSAYLLLHPRVQQWIYDCGWEELRDAQERAVAPVLSGTTDVIVAAATATGKTEAAWLPICSALLTHRQTGIAVPGVKAVYVGPLKALINDQYARLGDLCERVDVPIHRWHGDVAGSHKAHVLKTPDGILLITPESLESLFVNHGHAVAALLAGLRYIVIDELHSFIGTERGAQLQSLMHRVELVLRRRIPRIALSATLGDFSVAAQYLRPDAGMAVTVVASDNDSGEIRLQLRGYLAADPASSGATRTSASQPYPDEEGAGEPSHKAAIADHLFRTLRGSDNLVFANSRRDVELYADMLARRCELINAPNEFVPHYGNLAKELREHVETRLKDRTLPVTAVCTSTLEMGIDIGSVDSIAQVGAPATVAALRQRLGRSGRRAGQPAVLRMYVAENDVTHRTPPADALRSHLVQSIAMVELLLEKWYEVPDQANLHLSTLTQQVLSVIAQRGGALPQQLYDALCGVGPFSRVDKGMFAALLRGMGQHELIIQAADGLLLPGPLGGKIINHYSFYTAFTTPDEYRLVAHGRTLGSLPIDQPITPGMLLIFAGRRWKIVAIDGRQKVIELVQSTGGRPPDFSGGGGEVADTVRRRMHEIYLSQHIPRYLDHTAQRLLAEGRSAFGTYGLADQPILGWGNDTLLFPWRGDRVMNTLATALATRGLEVGQDGVALTIRGTEPGRLWDLIRQLASQAPPDGVDLAAHVPAKQSDKYDQYLDDELLDIAYAARALDIPTAWAALRFLAAQRRPDQKPAPTTTPDTGQRGTTPEHRRTPSGNHQAGSRRAQLGETPFAVIDLETTGFAAQRTDRVIEVAIVRLSATGEPESQWTTLVNPDRDAGPTHVHGLTTADLQGAPRFADIAGHIAEQLHGAIVVAHNARYDIDFLRTEFQRLGHEAPHWPVLCTLNMSHAFGSGPSRRLAHCCRDEGIPLTGAHSALGDATATAALLTRYMERARRQGITKLGDLGCTPLDLPSGWTGTNLGGRAVPRSHQLAMPTLDPAALTPPPESPPGWSARVHDDGRAAAYLEVLDRAYLDNVLKPEEITELNDVAQTLGLSSEEVDDLNQRYLKALTLPRTLPE